MKPNAHSAEPFAVRFNYAIARAKKREAASQNLNARVRQPVIADSVKKESRGGSSLWGIATVVLAVLLHASVVTGLMAFQTERPGEVVTEKAVFQVVEKVMAPPAEPEPDFEVAEQVIEQPITVEPAPQKKAPMRKVKAARADPVNIENPSPPAESKPRAVVGITMSSTVTGGSGPAYAVGNTRMGRTGAVQTKEKIQTLTKGRSSGAGGGDSVEVSLNQRATFIPTVSRNFTKPKRISSAALPYPSDLKSRGIEGNVMVLIVIDEQGRVQKVRVLKSSGYREFDEAALDAAKKEVYRPALRDGEAVEYNLKYTYRFRMKGA